MFFPDIRRDLSADLEVPTEEHFQQWAEAVVTLLELENCSASLSIVDADESQTLNREYRQKDKPTNVLSFPSEFDFPNLPDLPRILGDIIICAEVVVREANEQNKMPEAHWAHMTIHGILHLLGYDHQTDDDAEQMEGLEVRALKRLGYNDPYRDNE